MEYKVTEAVYWSALETKSKRGRMLEKIKIAIEKIKEISKNKKIRVVSHFDTDGITSAAIFSRALSRLGVEFSLEIVKGLEEDFISSLPEEELLIFLDLASNSLEYLKKKKTQVFILDHHEITQEIPENIFMINSSTDSSEPLSSAAICYLFAKQLSAQNKDLANLAVIGMIGDMHEKNIGKIFEEILNESDSVVKKGLLLYPSTRPLDRTLEYSSNPFLPGVTGSRENVVELLREANITFQNGKYKSLSELDEDEMRRLITLIAVKGAGELDEDEMIGNIFLVKFFNKLEDARELSALINACSRMGFPELALGFCLGNRNSRKEAEKIYITYKQSISSALKAVSETEKLEGEGYLIINARNKIKDTIIGTVASILSHSPLYKEGLIIVALAYNEDKIKVSARMAGHEGRNVREVLSKAMIPIGGEVGGHPQAAGCLISKENEDKFLEELRKILETKVVNLQVEHNEQIKPQ